MQPHYTPVPALGFDLLTPLFDHVVELLGFGRTFKAKVAIAAQVQPDERILDLGCGTATLLILVKWRTATARAIGIDLDPRILRVARSKIERGGHDIALVRAGAEVMPLADASVDVIMSSLTFHHLPTTIKRQACAEAFRVLKPAGRFMLADFGTLDDALARLLTLVGRSLPLPEVQTLQGNLAGQIPLFLRDAGFEVAEVRAPYRGVQFWRATKRSSSSEERS